MGRIITSVRIENASDPALGIRCDALVDTGAAFMTLPMAWKDRIGAAEGGSLVEVETATQETVKAEIFGPVRIQLEGFRAIYNEVLFFDMHPSDGQYEPLIGYLVLEQSQAAVDTLGHRLVHVKHIDSK